MISSIIFDLGGVIMNLRYETTIEAFSQLCGFDVSRVYTQHKQAPLFDDFETGRISIAEFRDGLRSLLGLSKSQASDDAIDAAWNAMLMDIPPSRVELLKHLRHHKRIFLLSNNNALHKAECDRIFTETYGAGEALDDLFEQAYYSHLMGDRKPHPSIFQRVIQEQQLDPAETLFVEDTKQHIDGAVSVGLQTEHLTDGRTIHDLNRLRV
jgi:putative hydrolase of the HAD superfamily